MVTRGVLEFQYQADTSKSGLTAHAGPPLYLDPAFRSGLVESVRRYLSLRRGGQGWTDERVVLALVLLRARGKILALPLPAG